MRLIRLIMATTLPSFRAGSASPLSSPKTALRETSLCSWVRRTWPSRRTRVPSVSAAPHWGQHSSSTSICLVIDGFLRGGHRLLQAFDADEHAIFQRGQTARHVLGVGGAAGGTAGRAVLGRQLR